MSTPICVPYATASVASEMVPLPELLRNLSPTSETCQHTPTTPLPLFPTPPTVPAQWVPCRWSSIGLLSLLAKSQPRTSST